MRKGEIILIFHRLLMAANSKLFKPEITNPDPENPHYMFEFEYLTVNSFEEAGGSGLHWYTEWQLSVDKAFTNIIHHSGRDFDNLESITVSDLQMDVLSDYYVRVRYASPQEVSEWSDPVYAKTGLFESTLEQWSDSIFEFSLLGF